MNDGGWRGPRAGSRRGNSFPLYALASIGTFAMAARAVHWLDGPQWLALVFLATGLALAGYYLVRALGGWGRSWRRRRGAGRR
ncbi:hypothetical protein [Arthrobacter sp. UYEF20]|uniref:hypothetical protein n=1 Tax=Arthrobacter sp. UYEF20 TaxID=1756363 RepID=UPI0033993C85